MMSLLFSVPPPPTDQAGRIVTQLFVSEGRGNFSSCTWISSPQRNFDAQEAYVAIGREEPILLGQVCDGILGLPLSPAVPLGPSAPAPVFFLDLSLSDVLGMHPWFFSSHIL